MQWSAGALLAAASLLEMVCAGPPAYYQIPLVPGPGTPLYLAAELGTPAQPAYLIFDLTHADSWAASHNCWSLTCTSLLGPPYDGVASTSHISDGNITILTSKPTISTLGNPKPISWQNLGLVAQDQFAIPAVGSEVLTSSGQGFLEAFEITLFSGAVLLPETIGRLGFGLSYGAQLDQTPFIYSVFQQGQVTAPTFATALFLNNTGVLFMGDVEDPGVTVYRGNYTAADVPIFIKDGTWNFQMTNLTVGATDTGFNGAAVISSLQTLVFFPRVMGAAIAELLGGTVQETPAFDFYLVTCNTTLLPDIVLSTVTGDITIPPAIYVDTTVPGPACPMRLFGRDVYVDQASNRPIIQLGWTLFFSQFIKYDYQNETLSFAPVVVPP